MFSHNKELLNRFPQASIEERKSIFQELRKREDLDAVMALLAMPHELLEGVREEWWETVKFFRDKLLSLAGKLANEAMNVPEDRKEDHYRRYSDSEISFRRLAFIIFAMVIKDRHTETILRQRLRMEEKILLRRALLTAAVEMETADFSEEISPLLFDSEPEIRELAYSALRKMAGERVYKYFTPIIAEESLYLEEWKKRILAEVDMEKFIDYLSSQLKCGDISDRIQAFKALAVIGTERAISLLEAQILEEESAEATSELLKCIIPRKGALCLETLKKALIDCKGNVRKRITLEHSIKDLEMKLKK